MTLEERRIANIGKQVDNASLPAGSPMYYYCCICGAQTDVRPEDWWEDPPPPKYCDNCSLLIRESDGLPPESYDDWLLARGDKPVPS